MNAIVVMAREPQPNKVKTRLTPPLNPQTASKIYRGFLLDRIKQISGISDAHHFIAYTPSSAVQFFRNITPDSFTLLAQEGKDLGERLSNISYVLFEKGYEKVIIMDSDSPNLPTNHIFTALKNLDNADLVLGPCEDGGYYLVGLSLHVPEIFKDIPWSTSEVMKTTIRRAESAGKTISFLEKWYDVDTKEDLLRLKNDLDKQPKSPNDMYFCKNTYEIMSEFDIK
ncbi:MAG: TIGR04282 family arsenosugar biosynthesis glycosyltransferase [Methanomassiliicoccales archaeon]|nr:MAG: TIGR04282 family arsenosugar biosynthesis glycosyltransferase [Methanomassiliicoccales archaeon]